MADGADAVARFSDGDTVPADGDRLEHREHPRIERADDIGALRGHLRDDLLHLVDFGRERAPVGVHALLDRGQLRFRLLDGRGVLVRFDHPFENLVFERLHLGLRELDLLLHRLVLDVGLDGHQLVAELRQTALVDGDLFLDLPPGGLALGQTCPGRGDVLLDGVQPSVQDPQAFGFIGDAPLRVMGGRVEPLKIDQTLDIGIHRVLRT